MILKYLDYKFSSDSVNMKRVCYHPQVVLRRRFRYQCRFITQMVRRRLMTKWEAMDKWHIIDSYYDRVAFELGPHANEVHDWIDDLIVLISTL